MIRIRSINMIWWQQCRKWSGRREPWIMIMIIKSTWWKLQVWLSWQWKDQEFTSVEAKWSKRSFSPPVTINLVIVIRKHPNLSPKPHFIFNQSIWHKMLPSNVHGYSVNMVLLLLMMVRLGIVWCHDVGWRWWETFQDDQCCQMRGLSQSSSSLSASK